MTSEESRARFESVAREVIEPVRRFLLRRTDPDTAEDALADTLLVCWRRREDLPGQSAQDALPWVYGVARHALANAERTSRRQRRLAGRIIAVDPPVASSPAVPEHAKSQEVGEALETLPSDQAEILRLWAWEDLTPSEIAVAFDISPNAVSIRLHRAKHRLGEALRKIDNGAGHEPDDEA